MSLIGQLLGMESLYAGIDKLVNILLIMKKLH